MDRDGQQQQHIIKFGVAEIMWQIYRQPFEINKPDRKVLTKIRFEDGAQKGVRLKKIFPQNIDGQYFEEII